ncbi:RNA-binding protein [Candidatus Pacearchaeota archaeon]|nr:RNA-binding protein [Candidatus Pacearchaeota archaeon]
MTEKSKKEIVIPGEIIAKGDEFLPGDWTMKQGDNVVSTRLGVVEKSDKLIKVIPLSGVYIPRPGNTVIGEVKDIAVAGWMMDVGGPYSAFLPLRECPGFIETSEMENVYGIGDLLVTQIFNVGRTSVDLTMKSRERGALTKIKDGTIIKVNPHRVPRVIGKEGSMISLIKNATKTNITVGQNGIIWIKGDKIDDELFAERAIKFIVENTTADGLTEKVEKWLAENKEGGKK